MTDSANIVITAITVLGSAGAWRFFEAKMKLNAAKKTEDFKNTDRVQYRDDLKNRIKNLEQFLVESQAENRSLQEKVLALTEEVSALRIKVEFLERENDRLKSK